MEKMGGDGLQEIPHFSSKMSDECGSSPFDHQSIRIKDHKVLNG